jgi:hypothetical protein
MMPWWQSIHREEMGTAAKHPPKQHDGKVSAKANAAKYPRVGGITRTAEPKRQRRQSIHQGQHGKASMARGHHTHGGAQATTAATPNIRTGQTKAKIKLKHMQAQHS